MAPSPRLALVLLSAALALLGLGLGAATQSETFLQAFGAEQDGSAAGNLIVLTASLVALGVTGFVLGLSRARPLVALASSVPLFVLAYLGTVLVQSAWPNYDVLQETRFATLSINPLVHDGFGAASVLLAPVVGIFAVACTGFVVVRRLLGFGPDPVRPSRVLAEQVSHQAMAAPLLVVAVAGAGAVALEAPVGAAVVHLLLVALALGILVVGALRTFRLAALVRNARLAGIVEDSLAVLRRVETGLLIAFASVALAGAFLRPVDLEVLATGRTFSLTTRSHLQLLPAALAPFVLAPRLHARAVAACQVARPHKFNLETDGAHPASIGHAVALGASLVLAVGAAAFFDGALAPWLAAIAPWALLATLQGTSRGAALLLGGLALVLWGIGNTVVAQFDPDETVLRFVRGPDVLALWRTAAAAALAGSALMLLQPAASSLPPARRWPLLVGVGVLAAAIVLLLLPLGAWIQTSAITGEEVGIGSVLAGQDAAVRWTMHVLALGCALGLATLVAVLVRPDWWRRGAPRTVPAALEA